MSAMPVSDLAQLLAAMEPALHAGTWAWCALPPGASVSFKPENRTRPPRRQATSTSRRDGSAGDGVVARGVPCGGGEIIGRAGRTGAEGASV